MALGAVAVGDGRPAPGCVMTDERVARAALTRLVEPGEPRVVQLLGRLGVAGLLAELTDELGALGQEVAGRAARLDAERDLELAERRGIRFLIPGDAEWPASLGDLAHLSRDHRYRGVPIGLWVRGPLRLTDLRALSPSSGRATPRRTARPWP